MAPFLAMAVAEVDIIDLRYFTGSLRNFIQQHNPDIVIALYSPSTESREKIDWSSHKDPFDFR